MLSYSPYRLSLLLSITTWMVLDAIFSWSVAYPVIFFSYIGIVVAYNLYSKRIQNKEEAQLRFVSKWEKLRERGMYPLMFRVGLISVIFFPLVISAAHIVIHGSDSYIQRVQFSVSPYPVQAAAFFLFVGFLAGIVIVKAHEKHYLHLTKEENIDEP